MREDQFRELFAGALGQQVLLQPNAQELPLQAQLASMGFRTVRDQHLAQLWFTWAVRRAGDEYCLDKTTRRWTIDLECYSPSPLADGIRLLPIDGLRLPDVLLIPPGHPQYIAAEVLAGLEE